MILRGFKDAASFLMQLLVNNSLLTNLYVPETILGEPVQQQLNIVFWEEASCWDAWKIIHLGLQEHVGSFSHTPHSLLKGAAN